MKTKGFTLIELLVVISIIAVLASIVMVSLNNARLNAQAIYSAQNINEFKKALYLYMDANNTFPIPSNTGVNHCIRVSNCVSLNGSPVNLPVDANFTNALSTYWGNSSGLPKIMNTTVVVIGFGMTQSYSDAYYACTSGNCGSQITIVWAVPSGQKCYVSSALQITGTNGASVCQLTLN